MFGRLSRRLLLAATALILCPLAALAAAFQHPGEHRDAVDVSRYPFSAIGKLTNETGASCSGVVIARDRVLTAAHCLFNPRSRRFIAAEALHFLVGYSIGRYSAHARVASYELGPGFDPLRYTETTGSDWAVLTLTEPLPASIEPLKLARDFSPNGTPAVMAGYPQDRAYAMTADSDCTLGDKVDAGRLYLNTCRGVGGYSGAPILVQAGDHDVRVAGIQIASINTDGARKMLAVAVQSIAKPSAPGDTQATKIAEMPAPPAKLAETRAAKVAETKVAKIAKTATPASGPVCDAPPATVFGLLQPAPVATWRDDTLFDDRLPQVARLAVAIVL
jgi:protease YdgD